MRRSHWQPARGDSNVVYSDRSRYDRHRSNSSFRHDDDRRRRNSSENYHWKRHSHSSKTREHKSHKENSSDEDKKAEKQKNANLVKNKLSSLSTEDKTNSIKELLEKDSECSAEPLVEKESRRIAHIPKPILEPVQKLLPPPPPPIGLFEHLEKSQEKNDAQEDVQQNIKRKLLQDLVKKPISDLKAMVDQPQSKDHLFLSHLFKATRMSLSGQMRKFAEQILENQDSTHNMMSELDVDPDIAADMSRLPPETIQTLSDIFNLNLDGDLDFAMTSSPIAPVSVPLPLTSNPEAELYDPCSPTSVVNDQSYQFNWHNPEPSTPPQEMIKPDSSLPLEMIQTNASFFPESSPSLPNFYSPQIVPAAVSHDSPTNTGIVFQETESKTPTDPSATDHDLSESDPLVKAETVISGIQKALEKAKKAQEKRLSMEKSKIERTSRHRHSKDRGKRKTLLSMPMPPEVRDESETRETVAPPSPKPLTLSEKLKAMQEVKKEKPRTRVSCTQTSQPILLNRGSQCFVPRLNPMSSQTDKTILVSSFAQTVGREMSRDISAQTDPTDDVARKPSEHVQIQTDKLISGDCQSTQTETLTVDQGTQHIVTTSTRGEQVNRALFTANKYAQTSSKTNVTNKTSDFVKNEQEKKEMKEDKKDKKLLQERETIAKSTFKKMEGSAILIEFKKLISDFKSMGEASPIRTKLVEHLLPVISCAFTNVYSLFCDVAHPPRKKDVNQKKPDLNHMRDLSKVEPKTKEKTANSDKSILKVKSGQKERPRPRSRSKTKEPSRKEVKRKDTTRNRSRSISSETKSVKLRSTSREPVKSRTFARSPSSMKTDVDLDTGSRKVVGKRQRSPSSSSEKHDSSKKSKPNRSKSPAELFELLKTNNFRRMSTESKIEPFISSIIEPETINHVEPPPKKKKFKSAAALQRKREEERENKVNENIAIEESSNSVELIDSIQIKSEVLNISDEVRSPSYPDGGHDESWFKQMYEIRDCYVKLEVKQEYIETHSAPPTPTFDFPDVDEPPKSRISLTRRLSISSSEDSQSNFTLDKPPTPTPIEIEIDGDGTRGDSKSCTGSDFLGKTNSVTTVSDSGDPTHASKKLVWTPMELKGHEGEIVDFKISGSHLLAGCEDEAVHCFNLKNGKRKRKYNTSAMQCLSVLSKAKGKAVLYCGGHDQLIRAFCVQTSKLIKTSAKLTGLPTCMDAVGSGSASESLYVGLDTGECLFLDPKTLKIRGRLDIENKVAVVCIATLEMPEKRIHAVSTIDNRLCLRNFDFPDKVETLEWMYDQPAERILYKDKELYCTAKLPHLVYYSFDQESGWSPPHFVNTQENTIGLCLSEKFLLVGTTIGIIVVFDTEEKRPVTEFALEGQLRAIGSHKKLVIAVMEGGRIVANPLPVSVAKLLSNSKSK